jgi:biopolymer transport protein ExbD
MNFQRGRGREEPEINLIPMIDVLLVILIFLMITTTYAKYAQLQINLPQAQGEAGKTAPNTLEVSVDALGHYTVADRSVPFARVEEFAVALKEAAGGNPDPVVIITADANTTHQAVVNVMEAARQAGFTHITFTTQSIAK